MEHGLPPQRHAGLVATPCAPHGRWSAYWGCHDDLHLPSGWVRKQARGSSVAAIRNVLARYALEHGADWMLWMDDDLTFRPDLLLRLLAHGKDAVVALSLRRQPPFEPLWFSRIEPVQAAMITRLPAASTGLVRIAACTSGAMLTSRRALEAVGDPWWMLGQYPGKPDEWNDDLWFCQRLADEGIELWGDPTTRCGHIADIEVWPHEQEGQCTTVLARGSTPFAALPMESTLV